MPKFKLFNLFKKADTQKEEVSIDPITQYKNGYIALLLSEKMNIYPGIADSAMERYRSENKQLGYLMDSPIKGQDVFGNNKDYVESLVRKELGETNQDERIDRLEKTILKRIDKVIMMDCIKEAIEGVSKPNSAATLSR